MRRAMMLFLVGPLCLVVAESSSNLSRCEETSGPGLAFGSGAGQELNPAAFGRVREGFMDTILTNRIWKRNFRRIFAENNTYILFAPEAEKDELIECVCVLLKPQNSPPLLLGTGTLIGKRVVLTAAHLWKNGDPTHIFIGRDFKKPQQGEVIPVQTAIRHTDYKTERMKVTVSGIDYQWNISRNDIGVLILNRQPAVAKPCPIADWKQVRKSASVLVAGFGANKLQGLAPAGQGVKRKAIMGIVTYGEKKEKDLKIRGDLEEQYGLIIDREFVVSNGAKDTPDTCVGDSGGPAYIVQNNQLSLAGVISRASLQNFFANPPTKCGHGTVLVRVDVFADWIKKSAAASGAAVP